jgi:uncharacterized protein (TIGR02246 family)
MSDDEKEIRELIATWLSASKTGDTGTVLSLMADDAIFLTPGQPPMTKQAFAVAAAAQAKPGAPKFDGESAIQEITIVGAWAFLWTKLKVVITPSNGEKSVTRSGHTLSVLKKQNGKWVLTRDANLLA